MTEEIIIAGFGGQGVLSMGKILAYSGIMQDQEVSWMPSYGPEMRGGTANVTVIISDDRISSPYLKVYDTAIILNQQSMDKFEETVKPGGILIYDPNGITHHPTRTDIKIYQIEGNKLANEMGNRKISNMVILGGYLKVKPIMKLDNVIEGLKKSLPERYQHLIPLNKDAITTGMNNVTLFKVSEKAPLS
ncbi:2-oxoacid:acceptor oxidoreductase family protein [Lutibacter sp.]